MIRFTTGNLLESHAEALVNTVNTVGIMGKGLALMFKHRFPQNFKAYAKACKKGGVRTGKMFITATTDPTAPRWIINFPTKEHLRTRTKLEWIQDGLDDLHRIIIEKGICSIAIPPLGCGYGGQDWSAVLPIIQRKLVDLESVDIIIYEPTPEYDPPAKSATHERQTAAENPTPNPSLRAKRSNLRPQSAKANEIASLRSQ